ncbi:unnamed protein product [Lupinus luteus]|uniref:Uncharacterized protein n=1 Tax=Lupinus luteus TaxID=3873 RepID=A0AAV1WWS8_LUPLU
MGGCAISILTRDDDRSIEFDILRSIKITIIFWPKEKHERQIVRVDAKRALVGTKLKLSSDGGIKLSRGSE